jgi:hypothetical protein
MKSVSSTPPALDPQDLPLHLGMTVRLALRTHPQRRPPPQKGGCRRTNRMVRRVDERGQGKTRIVRSGLSLLHVTNQPPLRPCVAFDVAFGRLEGPMAGEELDVARAASNVTGGGAA